MKKTVVAVFVLTLLASLVAFAAAENPGAASGGEPKLITISLKDTDVRQVLENLFRGSGKNFSITSDVTGIIPSFEIKDVKLEVALKTICKIAGLTYRMDGAVYYIEKKTDPAEDKSEKLLITIPHPLSAKVPATLNVKAGSTFIVSLTTLKYTDYSWQLGGDIDKKILGHSEKKFVVTAGTEGNIVGPSGSDEWVFTAIGPGKQTLKLDYISSEKKNSPPAKTAIIEVTVN